MAEFDKLTGAAGTNPVGTFEALQEQRKRQAALRASTILSQRPNFNPDQRAHDVNLSSALGAEAGVNIDPSMIGEQNRSSLQHKLDDTRINKLVNESERAANYLSNPMNAELAYDDLNTVGWWGGMGNAVARGADAVFDNARLKPKYGLLRSLERSLADAEQGFGDLWAQEQEGKRNLDEVGGGLAAAESALQALPRMLWSRIAGVFGEDELQQGQAEVLNQLGMEAEERAKAYPGSMSFDQVNQRMADLPAAKGPVEGLMNVFKVAKEDPAAFLSWSTQVAAESVPGITAATAVTIATRNPSAGAGVMGTTSAIRAEEGNFRELAEAGGYDLTDPDSVQALIKNPEFRDRISDQAFAYGAVVGIIDGISGGIASQTLSKNPAGDFLLQMMAQAVAGSSGEALGRLAGGQEIDWTEVVTEGIVELVTAPLEIAGVGGRSTVKRVQSMAAANERKKVFQAMADTTGESKLKGRSEAKYGEMVAEITKDGPVENVYVDPEQLETLFQSQGVTPEEFFDAIPDLDIREYQQARDAGHDFKIPTSVYAAKIIGSQFEAAMTDHLKFGPMEMSIAEANNLKKDIEKSVQDVSTTLERIEQEAAGFSDDGRREFESLTGQLRQAGRSPEVAAREALPLVRFAETQAQRAGVSTGEFLRRYALPTIEGDFAPDIAMTDGVPDAILTRLPGGVESASPEAVADAAIAAVEAGEITEADAAAMGVQVTGIDAPGQRLNQTRTEVVGGTSLRGDGRNFAQFFADVTAGRRQQAQNLDQYVPVIDLPQEVKDFARDREKFSGNFEDHIRTSIPGYREMQDAVGYAISQIIGDGALLDLGASEGAMAKTVAEKNPKSSVVALDPNLAMRDTFESKPQVDNAEFALAAFGSQEEAGTVAWTEEDGTDIRVYAPTQKFDIVHEAMVFQFISNARNAQVSRVKEMMSEGGLFLTFEKFGAEASVYNANEDKKDDYKALYYDADTLAAKKKEVLQTGGDQVEGMTDLQVSIDEMEAVLQRNFSRVTQVWDSGNFKGFAASDDPAKVDAFLQELAPLDSVFANVQTPREVGAVSSLDELTTEAAFRKSGWFVVSATGKEGAANRTEDLRADLADRGLTFEPLQGTYRGKDDGVTFLVLGDADVAEELGVKYGQESILDSRGLVFTDGSGRPDVPFTKLVTGDEAKQQAFYSVRGDGSVFSLMFGQVLEQSALEPNSFIRENTIVGPDGKPVRLFHGTNRQFDRFKDGRIFLTSRRGLANEHAIRAGTAGARVVEANVALENPLEIGPVDTDPDAYWLRNSMRIESDMAAGGHDAVMIWNNDGELMVIATQDQQVTQIAPANRGKGTYNGVPLREDGKLVLTHWSSERRDTIDPAKAGTGPLRMNNPGPQQSFFGVSVNQPGGYQKEAGLGNVRHTVAVDPKTMYPFYEDPAGLKAQVDRTKTGAQQVDQYLRIIKDAGYKGALLSEGPLGATAVAFEALPVESTVDESRVLFQSATDLLRAPLQFEKTPTIQDVGEALHDLHMARHGQRLDPLNNEEHYQDILSRAASELEDQLNEPNSGVGWYSKDTGDALAMISTLHPSIATNQTHRDLMVTFMGIFSNGLTPEQAFMLSVEAFEMFLETGTPPVQRKAGLKWSVRQNNVVKQLEFVEYMTETLGSVDAAMEWLKREHPRSDIDAMMRASGYHKKGRFITKKALAGPPARGMLVFGEKLGRYTMGLHGFDIAAEDVTIDVWYTRTYRRLIGGLLDTPVGPEGIVGGPTNNDREVIRRMTGDLADGFGLPANDVQAALWFFEKRLYDAQGIRNVEFGTNSEGARRILRDRGLINDEELDQRDQRLAEGDGSLRAYGGVGLATEEEMDAFFQRTPKGPRGQITLPPPGSDQPAAIRLFDSADLSTVLHESGHFYLYTLERMRDAGVEHAAEEWAALTNWWRSNAADIASEVGITEKQFLKYLETGDAGSPELTQKAFTGIQEYFARGFEAYLLEGKAPSNALRAAFESFMAWMLAIYRDAKSLRVNLDDEVRGVFDRLLATDEEIAQAQGDLNIDDMVAETAREMGLDPEAYERLVELTREARDEARQMTLRDIMAPIRAMRTKENREEKKRITEQVTDEVMAKRHNRVVEWLANGRWVGGDVPEEVANAEFRLDPRILAEEHGEGVEGRLPRGRRKMTLQGSGVSADDIAGFFGYATGADLIADVTTAPKAQDEIRNIVNARMQDLVDDPLDVPGAIEQVAVDALHGEKRGQLIVAELRAINRLASRKQPMTSRAQARAMANDIIARLPVREAIASHKYLAAERKFAEQASRDLAAGNIEEAFEAKRKQLLNHSLYAESRRVADQVGKAERLAGRLRKRSTRKNLAGEYLDAIDELLDRYDFRQLTAAAERRRGSLLAYVNMMVSSGRENELAIPDKVLHDARRRPYKTLSVRELEGVYDSLKNIEHTARMKQKLRDAKEQREFDEVVNDILSEFDENIGRGRPPQRVPTKFGQIRDASNEFVKLVENADTILRRIAGWSNGGRAQRHIKAAVDAAEVEALQMREKAAIDMEALYDVYTRAERLRMAQPRTWQGFDQAISKWDLISVALNVGNKDNFERLTSLDTAGAFTPEQVEALLENLDERDWRFIQSVWDYIDSFWPQIAERERRTTGVVPKKVEAAPMIDVPDYVKGGYYPIKYDARFSSTVAEEQDQDFFTNMQRGRFGKAQTRNGHTKERAAGGGGRTVQLGMQVFHGHVAQVVHDLAFSEVVNNTWKILQDPRIKAAFEGRGMLADHRSLEVWIQDVASGRVMTAGILGRMARHAKAGFTISKLAFRFSIIALQVTGLPQSAVVVGKANLAKALGQYAGGGFYPVAAKIKERSPFMRERETTFQRDIYDLLDNTTSGPLAGQVNQVTQFWMRAGFWAMQKVQFYTVDVPTWMAAYEQGLGQGMSDEEAGVHADRMVARAQASGLFADRSAIERGTLSSTQRQNDFIRLFTALGSYMFAKYNIATEVVGRTRGEVTGANMQSAKAVLSATIDMALLFTLEAVLYAAIKGRLPDDEDDDDAEWPLFLARETALSAMGTLPFVRDLASATQGFSGGGAYGGVLETLGRATTSLGEFAAGEEMTFADVKAAIDAAGIALPGIPASFLKDVIEAELNRQGGGDVSPLDYLLGPRR